MPVSGTHDGWSELESDTLRSFVKKQMRDNRLVGLSIEVIRDGKTVISEGFGYADVRKTVQATADTPFPIASVTKLFTATAIMRLEESGDIDLDAPVSTYLPEFSIRYRAGSDSAASAGHRSVTIRDLLSHTAGLPSDYLAGNMPGSVPASEYWKAFEKIAGRMASEYAVAEPGELYDYSNIGYEILGTVVSRVSGLPCCEYIHRNILQPLGMSSSVFAGPSPFPSGTSAGFDTEGKSVEMPLMRDLPAGGLVSTVHDLGAFAHFLLASCGDDATPGYGSVLGKVSVRRMLDERINDADGKVDFFPAGLGFHHVTDRSLGGVHIACHDGGTYPFSSVLMILPEYGIGVAVLVNTDEHPADTIALEAVRLALGSMRKGPPTVAATEPSGPKKSPPIGSEKLAGTYATEIGLIRIRTSGNAAKLELGGVSFLMKPHDDGSFGLRPLLFGVVPVGTERSTGITVLPVGSETEPVLAYYDGDRLRGLAAMIRPVPVSRSWTDRLGSYRPVNDGPDPFLRDLRLSFDEKTGFLLLKAAVRTISDPLVFAVEPLSDTELRIMGKGRHMGEMLTADSRNGTPTLRYSGLELERTD